MIETTDVLVPLPGPAPEGWDPSWEMYFTNDGPYAYYWIGDEQAGCVGSGDTIEAAMRDALEAKTT